MNYVFSALPTPFFNGKIDFTSLEKLILNQIDNKVYGLVFSGSTGEGHSLSKSEWQELIKFGCNYKDKIKIVAGVGFNITATAIEYAKIANEIGVDYILATTPYYNKPQQDGIYKHFSEISKISDNSKIILYNVPSRTATDMSNQTIAKLANDYENIVALKDATGKLERVGDLKFLLKNLNKDFYFLSGEDATQIGFNAMGGCGVISVVSNIAPSLCVRIQEYCQNNDFVSALKLQNELTILSRAMFFETNPVPVKYALYKLGLFKSEECRLPLISLTNESKNFIDEVLIKIGLIS